MIGFVAIRWCLRQVFEATMILSLIMGAATVNSTLMHNPGVVPSGPRIEEEPS